MAKLAVCVSVLLVLLVALNESSSMRSCCTKYQEKPIPVGRLIGYTIQEITDYCNIKAVMFKTVRNKLVCANPEAEWVKNAMASVPRKR
ncbi:C-C motif chemokine 20 [Thunnus thynnus]|uniref:C-C motif chemokine 20 n=1 Tax=Thunnus thynnus TaxID=8237 RepID=UPI003526D445